MPKPVADAIIFRISLRNYVDYYSTQIAICQVKCRYFFKNSHLFYIFCFLPQVLHIDKPRLREYNI